MGAEDAVVNAEGGDTDVGDLKHDDNDANQARVQANLSTLMRKSSCRLITTEILVFCGSGVIVLDYDSILRKVISLSFFLL